MLLTKERDKLVNQAGFVMNAVQRLKEQPITKEILGEDLKVGKASLTDGIIDKHHVKVRVPVKGERDNAYLYVYARRKSEAERLRLYKLEVTFAKVSGKKLVLMDRSEQEDPVDKEVAKQEVAKQEVKKNEEEPSPEEKRRQFIEQMKSWQPTR